MHKNRRQGGLEGRKVWERRLKVVGAAGTAVGENRILSVDAATGVPTLGKTYSTLEKAAFVARMEQERSNYTKQVYVFSKYKDGTSAIWIDKDILLWSGRTPKGSSAGLSGLGSVQSCIEEASEEAHKMFGLRKASDYDTQNLLTAWHARGKACGAAVDTKFISSSSTSEAMYFAEEQASILVGPFIPDGTGTAGSAERKAMGAFKEGVKSAIYSKLVKGSLDGLLGDTFRCGR